MASLQSRALYLYLRATRRKRNYRDAATLRARIEEERRTVDPSPPADLSKRCRIARWEPPRWNERAPCWTLSPLRGAPRGHVVYLHGGCYVFEIAPLHWRFCAALASRLGFSVTVPIYPLAPEADAAEVLRVVEAARASVRSEETEVTLIGDSAGGGMALALAQLARTRGEEPPPRVVLLAPWLDVAMTNPEVPAADAADLVLSRPGLVEAGRLYRGDIPADDPRVSPIHGGAAGLGEIAILIGTKDVFLPDVRRFVRRARDEGAPVTLFEYADMVHDFMLIDFLPEAARAWADLEAFLIT